MLISGPYRVWIVGPSHELAEKAWRVVASCLWRSRVKWVREYMRPVSLSEAPGMRRASFQNGAEIVALSAQAPDKSLLGEGVDRLHPTEAARISRRVWDEYLLPVTMDLRGVTTLDSTPRGDNWFRELYEEGQARRGGVESWRLPTWSNTAVFPGGEHDPQIERFRARLSTESFRQEIEASFVTFRGRLVPEFDRDVHGFHGSPPWMPTRIFGSVDWGYTHPTVLLVGGYDGQGRGVLLEEWAATGQRLDQVIEEASRLSLTWGADLWFAGNDNPEGIAAFGEAGLDCAGAMDDHRAGIDCLGSLMHKRPDGRPAFALSLDGCPTTARALEVAHYREKHGELCDQFHDEMLDQVDAARYLFLSARSQWDPKGLELPWLG